MRILVMLLRGFAYLWGVLLGLAIVVGFLGIWWKEGFSEVQAVFSPFNLWNWGLIFVLAAPAVGAHALAERLSKRQAAP